MGCFSAPEPTQISSLNGWQETQLNQLLQQTLARTAPGAVDPYQYQGSQLAGLSPLQQQAVDLTGSLTNQGAQTVGNLLTQNVSAPLNAAGQQAQQNLLGQSPSIPLSAVGQQAQANLLNVPGAAGYGQTGNETINNLLQAQGNTATNPQTAAGIGQLLNPQGVGSQGQQAISSLLNPDAQANVDAIFGRGNTLYNRELERLGNQFGSLNATSSSASRDARTRALEDFTLASQAQAAPLALQANAQNIGSIQSGLGALENQQQLGLAGTQAGVGALQAQDSLGLQSRNQALQSQLGGLSSLQAQQALGLQGQGLGLQGSQAALQGALAQQQAGLQSQGLGLQGSQAALQGSLAQQQAGLQAQGLGLQSQQFGLNQIPTLISSLFSGGSLQQAQQQAAINEQVAALRRQDPLFSLPAQLASQLSGFPTQNLAQTAGGAGPALAGAGIGALGSLGAAAMLASDIRVKENIATVEGPMAKCAKLKAYTYNYIGTDQPRVGLMAQDVEKVLPEAVLEINGVKHVDTYALQSLIIAALGELSERRAS